MKKNTRTALLVAIMPIMVAVGFMLKVINENNQSQNPKIIKLYPSEKTLSDFSLNLGGGGSFNNGSINGKWTVLFFGYTHCPDVCPTTMANLAKVVGFIKPELKNNLQVVLVSVDPERDTPDHLQQYVKYFNKNFKAATGSHDQLQGFAKALGAIYYQNKTDEHGQYLIDHTSKVFVINPKGMRAGIFDGQIMPPATAYPAQQIGWDLQVLLKR